ncbi:hypothetical protein BN381_130332 [Candidatus Microthrix parvicella RN1]|uniref:Uncharacterized protein n=1 Tax=Candidatus Neomicrothrix parvicella RN1 TaxID=1229780 RepID=R4YWY3_9ACTN|nr:hypothetical protein BN381_130332 [Candidatus Microthrix parvicella RN1]
MEVTATLIDQAHRNAAMNLLGSKLQQTCAGVN